MNEEGGDAMNEETTTMTTPETTDDDAITVDELQDRMRLAQAKALGIALRNIDPGNASMLEDEDRALIGERRREPGARVLRAARRGTDARVDRGGAAREGGRAHHLPDDGGAASRHGDPSPPHHRAEGLVKVLALVDERFVREIVDQLAKDKANGEWHGGEPEPTVTAVWRVLQAVGRLGYSVTKAEPVVRPVMEHDPPPPAVAVCGPVTTFTSFVPAVFEVDKVMRQ
jgi:hypothetical protein